MTKFQNAITALGGVPCFMLTGCIGHMFSPPARPMPLETAATATEGETRLSLEGAGSTVVFGPGILAGTARVRHGVGHDTEVDAEATAAFVDTTSRSTAGSLALSARLGVKHELNPHIAVTMGLGGGWHMGGGFFAPDLGIVFAYENPYFVPFFAIAAGVSLPIAPVPVDVGGVNDVPELDVARRTLFASGVTGVRISLGDDSSLALGVGLMELGTTEGDATALSAGLGLDLPLD